jgi:hypothetical protein
LYTCSPDTVYIRVFFENLSGYFKFRYNLTRITGTLNEDLRALGITSRRVLIRMRNVSGKSCTENQNTHFIFNNIFPPKSCRLWYHVEKYCTVRKATYVNIIQRIRIACWIPKATNAKTEYVIRTPFPLHQWLHERYSILRSTYIACLGIAEKECVYCAVRLRRTG